MLNFHANNFYFVFQETNSHINLRHQFIDLMMKLPDQDTYKLKRRIIDILAEWGQLLNDFSGYRWARTSPHFSLVYVSKSKSQGEQLHTMEVLYLIPSFIQHCECLQMQAKALYCNILINLSVMCLPKLMKLNTCNGDLGLVTNSSENTKKSSNIATVTLKSNAHVISTPCACSSQRNTILLRDFLGLLCW